MDNSATIADSWVDDPALAVRQLRQFRDQVNPSLLTKHQGPPPFLDGAMRELAEIYSDAFRIAASKSYLFAAYNGQMQEYFAAIVGDNSTVLFERHQFLNHVVNQIELELREEADKEFRAQIASASEANLPAVVEELPSKEEFPDWLDSNIELLADVGDSPIGDSGSFDLPIADGRKTGRTVQVNIHGPSTWWQLLETLKKCVARYCSLQLDETVANSNPTTTNQLRVLMRRVRDDIESQSVDGAVDPLAELRRLQEEDTRRIQAESERREREEKRHAKVDTLRDIIWGAPTEASPYNHPLASNFTLGHILTLRLNDPDSSCKYVEEHASGHPEYRSPGRPLGYLNMFARLGDRPLQIEDFELVSHEHHAENCKFVLEKLLAVGEWCSKNHVALKTVLSNVLADYSALAGPSPPSNWRDKGDPHKLHKEFLCRWMLVEDVRLSDGCTADVLNQLKKTPGSFEIGTVAERVVARIIETAGLDRVNEAEDPEGVKSRRRRKAGSHPRPVKNQNPNEDDLHGRATIAFLNWWIRGIQPPTDFVAEKLADEIGWHESAKELTCPWRETPNPIIRRYLIDAAEESGLRINEAECVTDFAHRLRRQSQGKAPNPQGTELPSSEEPSKAGEDGPPIKRYVFRKVGETWEFGWEDQLVKGLKDLGGYDDIRQLLAEAGKFLQASSLKKNLLLPQETTGKSDSAEAGLAVVSAEVIADPGEVKAYRDLIAGQQAILDDPHSSVEEKEEAETAIETAKGFLAQVTNKRGQGRVREPKIMGKTRKRIQYALRRLEAQGLVHLWRHLDANIKYCNVSSCLSYHGGEVWETDGE